VTGLQFLFWVFAAMAVAGGLATITRRNPVVAVVCLVGTFFAMAGLYATLHAHFLAAIQVLVYAGAIMVLFIFVVMLIGREETAPWWRLHRGVGTKIVGLSVIGYLVVRLCTVLASVSGPGRQLDPGFGTVRSFGKLLLGDFLFPFEAISVLLLVAIVGALVVARQHHEDAAPAPPAESDPEPSPGIPSQRIGVET
jgi:NADH-quinone oxidoreductase subunit J